MKPRTTLMTIATIASLLMGCESLGIKAHITSVKSVNGRTEVKHREAKNWDEFKSAMNEVGTDISDVAKEVGTTTTKLVKELVDAPPPGKVKLGSLDASLAKYEGNDKLDFVTAAAKKPDAKYDFSYVQIGVRSYDDFFKTAAEVYALAFQMEETTRRIRATSSALTGEKDGGSNASSAAEKARSVQPSEDNEQVLAYFRELDAMWKVMASQATSLVAKTAELVSKGQALIVAAPSSITNPKTVLHLKLIVKGLQQSVSLIKDSAAIMTRLAA